MNKQRIYLDYAATTPLCEAALSAMMPYLSGQFGNADSLHAFGLRAAAGLSDARRRVAACFNAKASEIFFTSGGTESNNWAVKGMAYASRNKMHMASRGLWERSPHILVSAIEHPSVLQSAERLKQEGFHVTKLAVSHNGTVSPQVLESSILPETCLISVMLANNEVGTIQPIAEIARVAKTYNIPLHTDAVQAAGTLALDVKELGVDLLTISAHKFYGPKGIGALYIRDGLSLRPQPLIDGGKQEREQRGGTSNVAAAVGMAAALTQAVAQLKPNFDKIRFVRDYFVSKIEAEIPGVQYNGDRENRLPQNANISFCGIGATEMLSVLDLYGVAAASGSACSSGSTEPSHVLTALGVSDSVAKSAIRFSFSAVTTRDDADFVVAQIKRAVAKLRSEEGLITSQI